MSFQHPSSHLPPPCEYRLPGCSVAGASSSAVFRHESEALNQRRMKQFVQEVRFKEKMEAINRKKGKYKRSTNNCHKKYIGILKNLLFLKLAPARKEHILAHYAQFKNSRVYYFIILCYLKWTLAAPDIRWIFQHFCAEVEGKIARYKLEISTTSNSNFVHFRRDEIIEMEYSIQAINLFLRADTAEAVRVLYQKNKYIIIKRNEYLRTLEIVHALEDHLAADTHPLPLPAAKLAALNLGELFRWDRNVNFGELDGLERLSKRRSREEREERSSESGAKEESCEEVGAGVERVKEEAEWAGERFPLLRLENSFAGITELGWHSWVIQKQKVIEFQLRNREDHLKRAAQAFALAPPPPL